MDNVDEFGGVIGSTRYTIVMTEYSATTLTMTEREKYLLAQAAFEWMKAELAKPDNAFRRDSDCRSLTDLMRREFASDFAMIEAKAELAQG